MVQHLNDTLALLSRTPALLDVWLRDLPDAWTRSHDGADTWSPFDIVGHLIDGERHDWIPRARIILEHGEAKTFEPFVRGGHVRETAGKTLAQLLDEFARVRAASLDHLRAFNLQPRDLERRGTHPAFGSVTLSQLLATWAAHDLTHVHQISRTMARQYRDAVGPWTAYLGVLHCDAHSQ
ncbi:MAG TPA: DinB family protein [Vicinamibacterales bacterium]|nr:DinB family protein [Vicinamibacterales bacterium]